jgi:hypothetical protein
MELFTKLFSDLLVFVYHCFDRVVIHSYLSGLSRPEQVVHFFRQVVGAPVVSKEVLSERTADYQNWVEAFARNHNIPIEWAEKGVRKEDYVQPWLRKMLRKNAYGVYFIFKSMEQGPSFRVTVPKFPTKDPTHRILARQKSRFTHDYFYIRDEVLGPIVMRVATFFPFQTTYYLNGHSFIEQELNRAKIGFRKDDNAFLAVDDVTALQAAADKLSPAIIRERLDYWTLILGPKFSVKERKRINLSRFYSISQIEYCRNFIFKRNFPIHKLFERSCELGLWRLTSHKISDIFGQRLHRRISGKLATVIDQIEHGHHVFRAYFKHAFLKQYEKFSRYLRNELCSNNLKDFGLSPGEIPGHYQPFRFLPGAVAQRSRRLSTSAAYRPTDHHRLGALSRHQDPRDPHHPPDGSSLARWHSPWWLDGQGDPPSRPHHLRPFRERVSSQPTALRSAQAQGSCAIGARRLPLRLPPHHQRRGGRAALSLLSQTAVWTPCQQPLPSSTRCPIPPKQPPRNRLSSRRQGHPISR